MQACANLSEKGVVVDRNLFTSRAPGTALEFALKLEEVPAGREKMEEIREQTLTDCVLR